MFNFIKNNFISLLILVVLSGVFIQRCSHDNVNVEPTQTVKRDTVTIRHDSIVYLQPQLIKTIPYPVTQIIREQIPDSLLRERYNRLEESYLSTNIYRSVIPVDSIGTIVATDTVQENFVLGSHYDYDIKLKTITNTVTITQPYVPKNELYIGTSILGLKGDVIHAITPELLYKTKKGNIFSLKAGYTSDGKTIYGAGAALKLLSF